MDEPLHWAIALPPEMELRVRQPDGSVDRQRVREGLTIGRSAASDLVVEDAEANLIHARVAMGLGGNWQLRAVGRSRMFLDDQSIVEVVDLTPGVTFEVGRTPVECEAVADVKSQMSKVKSGEEDRGDRGGRVAEATLPADSSGVVVEMPRLVICPSCLKDMTGVSVAARFCPKCGAPLPPRNADGFLIPPEESSPLYSIYKGLRDELEGKLADQTPQVATSMIILAYANALLNLGWKYEHGRGILRNVEEASRCYAKAGRLSEAWGKGGA